MAQETEDSAARPVVSAHLAVEPGHIAGYDENGPSRSLNGRLTGVHKVLCSAGEIA